MPPVERRSPSLRGICTRSRSFNILIGSFSLPGLGTSRTDTSLKYTRCNGTVSPVQRESVPLATIDDVTLQAEIDVPADTWAGAVIAHPHPLYGGDMYN